MPLQQTVLNLLAAALKKLVQSAGKNSNHREAARLVSMATQNLLSSSPSLPSVRAALTKARRLQDDPSPELVRAHELLKAVASPSLPSKVAKKKRAAKTKTKRAAPKSKKAAPRKGRGSKRKGAPKKQSSGKKDSRTRRRQTT